MARDPDNSLPTAALPRAARLRELAGGFGGARVALIGDVAADIFLEGETHRISREAPVLIVRRTGQFVVPGQAGNVARNLAALGGGAPKRAGWTRLVAAIGDDADGANLRDALRNGGVDTGGLMTGPAGYPTNTKTRVMAGGSHTRRQQIVRIDHDVPLRGAGDFAARLEQAAADAAAEADAVIVSDYGYEVITAALWERVRAVCAERGVPLLLDSRYRLGELNGATVITPNLGEALELIGHQHRFERPPKREIAEQCARLSGAASVVLKCGNDGMTVHGADQTTTFGVNGADEPVDVSGAGDTVVATLALGLAAGGSCAEAAYLANIAAGIAVAKIGTATVAPDELDEAIARWPSELRAPREA